MALSKLHGVEELELACSFIGQRDRYLKVASKLCPGDGLKYRNRASRLPDVLRLNSGEQSLMMSEGHRLSGFDPIKRKDA
mmetsp:Transcript_2224/g.3804  ORF Transcript_2224/g.3804 Transcript_2224/m.3804 type:complete len:80 (-) Transcript_2224:8-247(-)